MGIPLVEEPEFDASILEGCRQGDPEAQRRVFERYKDRVFSIALHFLKGDDAAAQDAIRTTLEAFNESAEDAFVVEIEHEPGAGGKVAVRGGSGKWAGATGDGTLEPDHAEGYRGSYHYEFRIATP